jgi:hypothetical protein
MPEDSLMTWELCDLYQCPNCRSKLLVLETPRTTSEAFVEPRCVCGRTLQRLDHDPETPMRTWTF